MEADTRTLLQKSVTGGKKMVPRLEGKLRRLRAICMLLRMRKDNTAENIKKFVKQFHELLSNFESSTLASLESIYKDKSMYLSMYREATEEDIKTVATLINDSEKIVLFTSADTLSQEVEQHGRCLLEAFT